MLSKDYVSLQTLITIHIFGNHKERIPFAMYIHDMPVVNFKDIKNLRRQYD